MTDQTKRGNFGIVAAILAYLMWGFLPLYFHAMTAVPAIELVACRICFTLPLCLVIVSARRQWPELVAAVRTPAIFLRLCASAALIASNWLIFVIAVNNGHVLASSLGYYINPLLNVLLGTLVLGERLNRTQWLAVGIAAVGIALLLYGAVDMLGVALALAVSFALYGLVRKLTPVGSVPGLTIETAVLFIPALGAVTWFALQPAGSSLTHGTGTALLLASSGVLTAVPLLLFAVAARTLDLSVLGFVQFLAPTISFLLGTLVFGEPLDTVRLACFLLIWLAIGVFSADILRRRRLESRSSRGD
ncbi:EamA family transporter RarD [Novosphingobium sp. KCTC 2891]|uniref:EamA family transporter RarD n=1 Tax=Novosphingobium sp. KCTC 2891 TaxID=2989730 RepID=UPI00222380A6|nr:EamA family transporter RarD [Novosphingobium sp. KCTC 2891]MCW1382590.1 EamA family transporter RarD [Novosphingobium sp. KCTC 2891]